MGNKPLFTKWDMEEIRNAGNILMGVIARGFKTEKEAKKQVAKK